MLTVGWCWSVICLESDGDGGLQLVGGTCWQNDVGGELRLLGWPVAGSPDTRGCDASRTLDVGGPGTLYVGLDGGPPTFGGPGTLGCPVVVPVLAGRGTCSGRRPPTFGGPGRGTCSGRFGCGGACVRASGSMLKSLQVPLHKLLKQMIHTILLHPMRASEGVLRVDSLTILVESTFCAFCDVLYFEIILPPGASLVIVLVAGSLSISILLLNVRFTFLMVDSPVCGTPSFDA